MSPLQLDQLGEWRTHVAYVPKLKVLIYVKCEQK